jgi:hypothetical protein
MSRWIEPRVAPSLSHQGRAQGTHQRGGSVEQHGGEHGGGQRQCQSRGCARQCGPPRRGCLLRRRSPLLRHARSRGGVYPATCGPPCHHCGPRHCPARRLHPALLSLSPPRPTSAPVRSVVYALPTTILHIACTQPVHWDTQSCSSTGGLHRGWKCCRCCCAVPPADDHVGSGGTRVPLPGWGGGCEDSGEVQGGAGSAGLTRRCDTVDGSGAGEWRSSLARARRVEASAE